MFGGFHRKSGKGSRGPARKIKVNPFKVRPQRQQRPQPAVAVKVTAPVPAGSKVEVLLSVLISSVRPTSESVAWSCLEAQAGTVPNGEVELLFSRGRHDSDVEDLNRLVREASGRFVLFLCPGDEVAPEFLASLLWCLKADLSVDGVRLSGTESVGYGVPVGVSYAERSLANACPVGPQWRPAGWHTPIRRDLALAYPFRQSTFGVKQDWTLRMIASISRTASLPGRLHHHHSPGNLTRPEGAQDLKVSVILTSYNRPTLVRQALRSLEVQTHRNFELLVFDDSSKMDIRTILPEFKVPVACAVKSDVSPSERGSVNRLSLNINKGLSLASGDLVCFLADDDYYYPRWLEAATDFFAVNPKVMVGYGRLTYSTSMKMEYRSLSKDIWTGGVVVDPFERLDHNQVIHRRMKKPLRWPEDFSTVGNPDAHYFKKLAAQWPFHPIHANAAVKRLHSKNLQVTVAEVAQGRAENFRE